MFFSIFFQEYHNCFKSRHVSLFSNNIFNQFNSCNLYKGLGLGLVLIKLNRNAHSTICSRQTVSADERQTHREEDRHSSCLLSDGCSQPMCSPSSSRNPYLVFSIKISNNNDMVTFLHICIDTFVCHITTIWLSC